MCSAQDVPPYLVYIKGAEKRNVKNAKKMISFRMKIDKRL